MSEELERTNCPMCGTPCTIEGKDGSTRYYAPIAFTPVEIQEIRVLLGEIDEQLGRYDFRRKVIYALINKCDAILKGAAE